jgi:ribosomal protein L14
VKDANQKASVVASLKESFNEKVLKDQFNKNLTIIPKKGVKIGEKWTSSENADPNGKIKVTSNDILKSVGNVIAEISVTGGIPKKTEKQAQGAITHSLSSELAQNGTIKFDQNTGWITNQNIKVVTTQIETISDGKQSQSMKSVSNSSVMVNPSAK